MVVVIMVVVIMVVVIMVVVIIMVVIMVVVIMVVVIIMVVVLMIVIMVVVIMVAEGPVFTKPTWIAVVFVKDFRLVNIFIWIIPDMILTVITTSSFCIFIGRVVIIIYTSLYNNRPPRDTRIGRSSQRIDAKRI